MKVILMNDMDGLGEAGEVVEVASGYARNFLIPRGLAEQASPEAMQRWEEQKRQRRAAAERAREEARELAAGLDGVQLEISARAGESGRLFGSVTAKDITDALMNETQLEIDRRRLDLEEPLRELGEHDIRISLYENIDASIKVTVVSQEE